MCKYILSLIPSLWWACINIDFNTESDFTKDRISRMSFLAFNIIYLKGIEKGNRWRGRDRECLSTISLPYVVTTAKVGPAQARSQELLLDITHECQGLKFLNHHLPPHWHTRRELNWKWADRTWNSGLIWDVGTPSGAWTLCTVALAPRMSFLPWFWGFCNWFSD